MTTTLQKHRTRKIAAHARTARVRSAAGTVAGLRMALGMPRSKFARLVGRTERAIIDWETGKSQPQGLSQQRVRELERLTHELGGLFDSKTLGVWFHSPNKALGGFKPVELIERGESDRLWRMAFELKSGSHA